MLCRPVRISSPHQILQHGGVFVLPSTVVCVQAHSHFPKAIVLKIVVEKTNYSVGSFSCVTSFINDEVYLPWDSFTANAKDGRLPRCKEVDWAGLGCSWGNAPAVQNQKSNAH